jgi:hypothetical protein
MPRTITLGKAGQQINIYGKEFILGADDYFCRFKTSILSVMKGDFEVRSTRGRVTDSTQLLCDIPADAEWWDLPGASANLEIFKGGTLLPKAGSSVQVDFLAGAQTLTPSFGSASGGLPVVIVGSGFDASSDLAYRAADRTSVV